MMKAGEEQISVDEEVMAAEEAPVGPEVDAPERELESSTSAIERLEQALAARDSEIDGLKRSLDELKNNSEVIGDELTRTVTAYRGLTLRSNPGVLAELVTGNSVEEIDGSLHNARVLVDKVRQEIEAETLQARVPAGAPQRSMPDTSTLSPREKIQLSLGGPAS
jgi:predicted RNase H-like nuclease (RuvC/YqgF family)